MFAGAFADVPTLVCYAMKANSNQAVMKTLARLGAGADVVSAGELKRARAAGIPPDKIMFSGIGKTAEELALAVDEGILCVNVESEPELELLATIAAAKGRSVNISLRVNPDVDPRTHAKIATGKAENKFGIPISRARAVYAHAARLDGVRVAGVDMHIGSQITALEPFDDAFALLSDFVRTLRHDGHRDRARRSRWRPGNSLPGRQRAAATSGRLCGSGQARHQGSRLHPDLRAGPPDRRQCRHPGDAGAVREARRGETFVIVDAAMNDLIRPTLYDAHHEIRPAVEASPAAPRIVADVVGPVCEFGDFLALDRDMPAPQPGDLLAVMSAGAYGAVQAGTYNTRALVPEVLVHEAQWALVRPRVEVEELIALDRLPEWL